MVKSITRTTGNSAFSVGAAIRQVRQKANQGYASIISPAVKKKKGTGSWYDRFMDATFRKAFPPEQSGFGKVKNFIKFGLLSTAYAVPAMNAIRAAISAYNAWGPLDQEAKENHLLVQEANWNGAGGDELKRAITWTGSAALTGLAHIFFGPWAAIATSLISGIIARWYLGPEEQIDVNIKEAASAPDQGQAPAPPPAQQQNPQPQNPPPQDMSQQPPPNGMPNAGNPYGQGPPLGPPNGQGYGGYPPYGMPCGQGYWCPYGGPPAINIVGPLAVAENDKNHDNPKG